MLRPRVAFCSGRPDRIGTWSRMRLRGACQGLVALESVWEFGKWVWRWAPGVRGVGLRASEADLPDDWREQIAREAPRGMAEPGCVGWGFGSGRGVVLRASSDDLVAHVCDAAPAPRGHPSPYEGEGIGRSGAV